ncbi:hypothetical protein D3C84_1223680 [compost metagenome]
MLSVIRSLQVDCQEFVSSLSFGRYPAEYTHILSGAVFGAILPILDGSLQVRFPDQTETELPEAMTFEQYLDTTFDYLRKGF